MFVNKVGINQLNNPDITQLFVNALWSYYIEHDEGNANFIIAIALIRLERLLEFQKYYGWKQ